MVSQALPVLLMGSMFWEAVLYLCDSQTATYIQSPRGSSESASSESVAWSRAEILHI